MNMMAPALLACLQVVVLTVRVFLDLWRTLPFDFSGMTSIIHIIAFSISNILGFAPETPDKSPATPLPT